MPRNLLLHNSLLTRCLVAGFLLLPSVPSQASVLLVADGKTNAVIVLPQAGPPGVVSYAASELQYHVQKASGVKLRIVSENAVPQQPAGRIYLGDCQATRQAKIDSSKLPPEAFVLRTQGNAVFVAGRDQSGSPLDTVGPASVWAGTLFGVYELLEEHLGVRWLWPGELGEFVPKTDRVVIADTDKVVKPPFIQRWIRTTAEWHAGRHEEQVWMRRHRHGNSTFLYPTHAFRNWWAMYGKEHPEYFALVNAKRLVKAGMGDPASLSKVDGQRAPTGPPSEIGMCLAEPRLWRQIVENWQKLPEESPGVRPFIDVSENDGGVPCSCEKCEAWAAPLEQMSDRYAKFWMAVQREARKIDPEATIITFAYSNYSRPPVETKLNNHVIISMVPNIFPFPPTVKAIAESRRVWLAWAATGAQLYLRPNWLLQGYCMPYVYAETFGDEFHFAAEHGAIGTDFDALTGMYATQGPTLYLLGRMQVKPHEDPAKLLQEYYNGFGPAAQQVQKYFDYWGGISEKVATQLPSWPYWPGHIHKLYRAKDFARAQQLLQVAANACRADETARARVRFLEKGLEHARLCFEAAQAMATPAEVGEILAVRANGTNSAIWSDGVLQNSEADTSAVGTSTGPLKIGKGFGDRDFWGGIAEILIYNRALSDAEMNQVGSYLEGKYSLDTAYTGPATLVTTGLQLWLKADAITGLNDNDRIAVWPDSSPNGNDSTQAVVADQPTWSEAASTLGGMPAVHFDGQWAFNAGDGLTTTKPLPGGDHITLFVVLDILENAGERGILGNQALGAGFALLDSKGDHENEYSSIKPGKILYGGSTLPKKEDPGRTDRHSEVLAKLARFRKTIEKDYVANLAYCRWSEENSGWNWRLLDELKDKEVVETLPLEWQFKWDPQEVGQRQGWYMPKHETRDWLTVRTDLAWEKQKVGQQWKKQHGGDYDGLAWYRISFNLPPGAAGKQLFLLFGAVDEGATVWLNGRLLGEHPFRKPSDWYTPFEMKITEHVRSDRPNVLVVLVEDRVGLGGVWKRVHVVTH